MFSRKLHIVVHPGEGLQTSGLDAPRLRPVSREGCLSCQACCDTGPQVLRSHMQVRHMNSR